MVHELRYTIIEKGEKSMEFGTMWYSEWEGGLDAGYEDLDVPQFGGADYEVIIRVDYEGKEKLQKIFNKKIRRRKIFRMDAFNRMREA